MRRGAILFLLVASISTPLGRASERPPNVVLILADDLGLNPVGAYGNPYAATPVLDQFAREGLVFTAAYAAAPVCSPSRAAMMTGKSPARTRLTDFVPGHPFPYARLLQPKWRKSLNEKLLPHLLAERGYITGVFGKWHVPNRYTPPSPTHDASPRHGFHEAFITEKPSEDSTPETDPHSVHVIKQRALSFIERHQHAPFFLHLAPHTIHSPLIAPAALETKHRLRPGAQLPENNPIIAAMMEELDAAIGEVLAKLDALNLAQDTLVIFASDNGGSLKDATQAPLRGGKAQPYEGGLRVPLIMRWPGTIAAGTTTDVLTTSTDLFATVLDVTGTSLSDDEPQDSVSLLPVLRGESPHSPRPLIWHYPHYHTAGVRGPASAIRHADWKLIHYYEHALTAHGTGDELFNLRDDPGEARNLILEQPTRAAELLATLQQHLSAAGAQLPTINENFDPARATQLRP
ncbi:MAG TPA: sulfatase [Opitutus sp.]|nr:sulfatase [Opitutus sp.]